MPADNTPAIEAEREARPILKTLHVKVRPDSWAWLNEAAREVNTVWNHVNEMCSKAARPYYGRGTWLSAYDVDKTLSGSSKFFDRISAQTISVVGIEHAKKRIAAKRPQLSWRRSGGSRRSLGWVPFRRGQVKFRAGAVVMSGRRFRVFDSYGLGSYDLRSGSFAQNALGEWFLNVFVHVTPPADSLPARAVGIDLGIKDIATTSDGDSLPAGRWYRGIESKLAQAQRRGHKRHAKRLQRNAANRRKDALHKFSTAMVRDYGAIYIGDVKSANLTKSTMAKSVLDSGWYLLKTMLQHKGHQAGRIVEVVNESFTTQACADCGSLTGPKGRGGLVVREWTCVTCGSTHSRDINAARNILAAGLWPSMRGNLPSGASTTRPTEKRRKPWEAKPAQAPEAARSSAPGSAAKGGA